MSENKSQALVPIRPEISQMLTASAGEFKKALGQMVPVDYFMRVALTTLRKSPLVANCTTASLMASLMDCAQLRLVPDSITGEAYLVPFWNNKVNGYEAQLMIGYKGFIKLLRANTDVKRVEAEVVCENDRFTCRYGTSPLLEFIPNMRGDRGNPVGAYALIETTHGTEFRFTPQEYIDRVRRSSKAGDKPESPWNMWPEAMAAKTALKQLLKFSDISPDVRTAIEKDMDLGAIDVSSTVVQAESRAAEKSKLVQLPPVEKPEREQETQQPEEPAEKKRGPGRPPKPQQSQPAQQVAEQESFEEGV